MITLAFFKRHWQLLLAIFIFTFPVGLYGFFRLFAENTYALPIYLQKDNPNRQPPDSCHYQIPYNVLEHPMLEHLLPQSQQVDGYVLSPQYDTQLAAIVTRTQSIMKKKHGQSFATQHIAINQPCMLPLHMLFPNPMPANWAVLADSQGQVRSFFSLTGDKGVIQAKNDLYLLATEAMTHRQHQ